MKLDFGRTITVIRTEGHTRFALLRSQPNGWERFFVYPVQKILLICQKR